MPTPEEIARINKERVISDAELIKGGAQYVAGRDGKQRLDPAPYQIEFADLDEPNKITEKEIAEFYKLALELGLFEFPKGYELHPEELKQLEKTKKYFGRLPIEEQEAKRIRYGTLKDKMIAEQDRIYKKYRKTE